MIQSTPQLLISYLNESFNNSLIGRASTKPRGNGDLPSNNYHEVWTSRIDQEASKEQEQKFKDMIKQMCSNASELALNNMKHVADMVSQASSTASKVASVSVEQMNSGVVSPIRTGLEWVEPGQTSSHDEVAHVKNPISFDGQLQLYGSSNLSVPERQDWIVVGLPQDQNEIRPDLRMAGLGQAAPHREVSHQKNCVVNDGWYIIGSSNLSK